MEFEIERGEVTTVRGDDADVSSSGYVCAKGLQIIHLANDPDRLTQPMRRTEDGTFVPISWDVAMKLVVERITAIRGAHGDDAVAAYMGTVSIHKHDVALTLGALRSALKTRNWMGVSAVDAGSRFVAAHLLYGSAFSLTVPDIDRTAYFLCLGANPIVSNGSMMTAPNMRERLRAIIDRGGKVVVVDPRFTETARMASEHIAIRPGTDAAFLFAMTQHIITHGLVDLHSVGRTTRGLTALRDQLQHFTPASVATFTGVPRATIERIAEALVHAPTGVVYSRMGPSCSRHSTLACYAVELLNIITGRLGAVGGSMFPTPAIDLTRLARFAGSDGFDRHQSRVHRRPEVVGELPAATLAAEIETPGPGQVRGLITYAGNPVLSIPNGRRISNALDRLEFMVSIDIYINETTRYADVILPPASILTDEHADLYFANLAVRNVFRWSDGVVAQGDAERADWQILLELTERLGGLLGVPLIDGACRLAGLKLTPAHLTRWALRAGPYGDHFLPWKTGLNEKTAKTAVHGVDLGPLQPGFRRRVKHRGKRIRLAAAPILEAMKGLALELSSPADNTLLLIGRRDPRSHNSWLHNVPKLSAGRDRCVLFMHPEDAAHAGLLDGDAAILQSRVHRGSVPIRVTDEVMPGVVSLPHGFGHKALGRWQRVACKMPGVSANDWTDDGVVDEISGQAVLNGVPVRIYALDTLDNGPATD